MAEFWPLPILHPIPELDFCLISSAWAMEQKEMSALVPGVPSIPQNVAHTMSPPWTEIFPEPAKSPEQSTGM